MSHLAPKTIYRHHGHENCSLCETPIVPSWDIDQKAPRWRVAFRGQRKTGETELSLSQVCDSCGDMEIAIVEAEAEQRRFTHVATFNRSCSHGMRCNCGAVTLIDLGACIPCSIARRMLTKAQAESREIANLLKQLRKEAKEALKG